MARAEETTALVQSQQNQDGSLRTCLITMGIGITMISFSVGLLNFNKWLMAAERFPHAVPLTLVQMILCSCFALVLRVTMPSMFPALTDPCRKVLVDSSFMLKGVVPIAVVFTTSMLLNNLAFTMLSIAFMQMVKESNIVWTYLLALIVGVEKFSCARIQLIFIALLGMSLTVSGELNFVLGGFVIQLSAVFCDACRIIFQSLLLQQQKLDPLSYVLLVSPICGALLTFLLGLMACAPDGSFGHGMSLPPYEKFLEWAPWLIANSVVAFGLNVSIAMMIKYAGPMSFIMCQILKDVVAVAVGVIVIKEMVTEMQFVGFAVQISVVGLWSMSKLFPEKLELGLIQSIMALCGSEEVGKAAAANLTKGAPDKTQHRKHEKAFEESA